MDHHPRQHRGDKDRRAAQPRAHGHQRGPRAKTADSPASAKQHATDDQPRVDDTVGGNVHAITAPRAAAPSCGGEGEHAHRDRATHHQGQTRVPRAGHVQKTLDLARVGHAAQDQTKAEDQPAQKCHQLAHAVPFKARGA